MWCWSGVADLLVCSVALLVGVMRIVGCYSWAAFSMEPGAWSVMCADCRSLGQLQNSEIIVVLCSDVSLEGARPLSPFACNTPAW